VEGAGNYAGPSASPHPGESGHAAEGFVDSRKEAGLNDPIAEDTGMTAAELLALRRVLANQRHTLLDRLEICSTGIIDPGCLRLLADTHTAVAAVDAALAESTTGASR
jgi:hypothetical protein